MKPRLYEYTSNEGVFGRIISCLSKIDCTSSFDNHLNMALPEQKLIIDNFQLNVCSELLQAVPGFQWKTEHIPTKENKDSIDIYGSSSDLCIVIELDKHRADQVAKKFVSRSALLEDKKIFYISLCYPGTSSMNANECIKYFSYCNKLSQKLNNFYAGFIIK